MTWKTIDIYPAFKGIYKINEYGDVKSVDRVIEVPREDLGMTYLRVVRGKHIKARTNNKHPHLFVEFFRTERHEDGTITKHQQTAYVHKLVAQMFKVPRVAGSNPVFHPKLKVCFYRPFFVFKISF
jgi:hypothetical protein